MNLYPLSLAHEQYLHSTLLYQTKAQPRRETPGRGGEGSLVMRLIADLMRVQGLVPTPAK
jgi:hypothetical protein